MLTLNVAGWRIGLEGRPAGAEAAAAARYAAFVAADPAPPDTLVVVTVDPAADAAAGAAPGEPPFAPMRVTYPGETVALDAPGVCGRIAAAGSQAWLELSGGTFFPGLEYFLRVLCALLAYRDGSLLMHAAGLLVDGGVHLFIGHSGSGKSTVVALSPQACALGDDLIVLRPEEAGWRAYGTPFWNPETVRREGQTASGRLVGIYTLVQDREVYLQAMSAAAAAAELAAHCPVVNGDPARLAGLLGRCRQLGAAAPVRRLHFRKDPGFWNLL